jgi:hypothetical protein
MKARHAVLVALAAAVTLTSVAAAGPEAAKQQVVITSKGVANPTSSAKFVLTPLRAGPVKRDSGTESAIWKQRVVMRDGQRVSISNWLYTLKGKLGNFVIRARIEYVEAGNGYHVGIGTWKTVRGTGQYAQIEGGGRIGSAWLDNGPFSERRDGFLTLP